MKRWQAAAGAVVLVVGLVIGGLWVHLTPDHRTTFLVDASESSDFREVADEVAGAGFSEVVVVGVQDLALDLATAAPVAAEDRPGQE